MRTFSAASLALASAILVLPGSAFAACQGQGGLICGSGAPQISSAADLQVSRGGNFTPLAAGAGLRGGDRILTGSTEASLSLGPSCMAAVGPGSLVTLSRSGGRTCASVTNQAGILPQEPGTTGAIGDEPRIPPAAIAAGVAAAAAGATGLGFALSGSGGVGNFPVVTATVSAR